MGEGHEGGGGERRVSEAGQGRAVEEVGDRSCEVLVGEAAHALAGDTPASLVGRTLVGRFEVTARIGAGGMGVVYRAIDRESNRTVALKTLSLLDGTGVYRLKQEFRALAGVMHPNLVQLHDLFSDQHGRWFFTMQLVDGVPFVEHVRTNVCASTDDRLSSRERGRVDELAATVAVVPSSLGVLREVELRAALRQLVAGVCVIHAAGKLHRDLKPSNVLVSSRGHVTILDFGLVRPALRGDDRDHSRELSGAGTPAYMAPEQLRPEGACTASDWYAVGAMLYEALTGRLPFEGELLQVLGAKLTGQMPPAPGEVVQGAPEDLSDLAMALLAPELSARPEEAAVIAVVGEADGDGGRVPSGAAPTPRDTAATFVGRARELEQLGEALEASRRDEPSIVYVHGLSGIGKSALVRRFVESLPADTVVLSGRCYERENVPFKALDAVVDALSRYLNGLGPVEAARMTPLDVVELCQVFPVLGRVAAFEEEARGVRRTADPLEVRRRAFLALKDVLGRIAKRRALVITIDDLQWGDADSGLFLTRLLEPPDAPALLLIGSYRSDEVERSLLLGKLRQHAADARRQSIATLCLAPLDGGEARELAGALLRDDTDEALDSIVGEAGGSPFFITELSRRPALGGRQSAATLAELIEARVRALPETAQTLLEVVSIAGRPVSRAAALQAAGLQPGERDAVLQLEAAFLLRGTASEQQALETYHDRIRETVTAALSEARAPGLHHALAEALEALPEPPADALAIHYREAGALDEARVYAERAAERAAAGLAFDRAADHYGMALELTDVDAEVERRRLGTLLGEVLANAGRGVDAAEAYLAASKGAPEEEALELDHRAFYSLLVSGYVEQGLALARTVTERLGIWYPRSALVCRLIAVLRMIYFALTGPRISKPREVSLRELQRADVCLSLTLGLAFLDHGPMSYFGSSFVAMVGRFGEPWRLLWSYTCLRLLGGGRGKPTGALARWTGKGAALAEELGTPYANTNAKIADAVEAYSQGRWRGSLEAAKQAEASVREATPLQWRGLSFETNAARAFLTWSLYYLGEFSEIARRTPALAAEAESRGDLAGASAVASAFGTVAWLIADDVEGARREADKATRCLPAAGFLLMHLWEVEGQYALCQYTEQPERGFAFVEERWPAFRRSALGWHRELRMEMVQKRADAAVAAALVAPTPTEAHRRLRLADRLARELARSPVIGGRPLGMKVRAAVAHQRGQAGLSVARLRQAAAEFDQADMAGFAAAARYQLGKRLGGDEGAELVEGAETFFREQSVVRPDRFADMLVPGFRR